MYSLAIIPARGGSKRLKRKNIIDFEGQPIISYTIKAALKSNCFDRIVISTDDDEIFKISSNFHDDVVIRSPNLATDKSKVVDVCDEFLKSELRKGKKYDILTVLYPTAPMRTSEDIKKVFDKISTNQFTSSIAVTTFSLPVHQAVILDKNKCKMVFPEKYFLRSNEVPKYYVDNGSTYSIKVENFLQNKRLITDKLGIYEMPQERSVDIDNNLQLEIAKFLYKKFNNNEI